MNLKIIHSEFEIDLIETNYTVIEENNWFSDKLFVKYSFPISKILTDEENISLHFITEHSARDAQTVLDVIYVEMDVEHKAIMRIEKIIGRRIEFQILYGFEEFPNFHKHLNELPLQEFKLDNETIFEHAEGLISFSEKNYNFPKVYTERFDKESDQWHAFEDYINNYDGANFKINTYDSGSDLPLNRNVVQPFPSLLYVLRTGFSDAGFVLDGDILTDPEFKDAYIFTRSEFYSQSPEGEGEEWKVLISEYDDMTTAGRITFVKIVKEFEINEPGRYAIIGNVYMRGYELSLAHTRIRGKGSNSAFQTIFEGWTRDNLEYAYVNTYFNVRPGNNNFKLYLESIQNFTFDPEDLVIDLTITKIADFDGSGNLMPPVVSPNEINLKECVPDMTFGDLFHILRTWKNYGVSVKDNKVFLNLVKNELGKGEVIDLTDKEVLFPERKLNNGKSFELAFQETDQYPMVSYFIDNKGLKMSPYSKRDDTQEVIINGLPLPLHYGEVTTAHDVVDDNNRLQLVIYTGLNNGQNTTQNPSGLELASILENYYIDWFHFLLNTETFTWDFVNYLIDARKIKSKSTLYAYGMHHVVKRLQKKKIAEGIVNIEIETHSIE